MAGSDFGDPQDPGDVQSVEIVGGLVSEEDITWGGTAQKGVNASGGASVELAAASAQENRYVMLKLPSDAGDSVRFAIGEAVDQTKDLLEPGERIVVNTTQAINAISDGTNTPNVYVTEGTTP